MKWPYDKGVRLTLETARLFREKLGPELFELLEKLEEKMSQCPYCSDNRPCIYHKKDDEGKKMDKYALRELVVQIEKEVEEDE